MPAPSGRQSSYVIAMRVRFRSIPMRLFLATLILAAGLPAQGAKAPVKIVGNSHKPILFSAFGVTAEGQGAGDSDLGGDFGPALPTTETIELRIVVEPGKELACGDEIVNGFCEKIDEQSLVIGGRSAANGRRPTTEASS